MTDDEFMVLLDRHGADLALWPDPDRRAAAAMLKHAAEARRQLRLAEQVAALIAAPPPDTTRLQRSILAALPVPAVAAVPRGLVASAGATLMASLAAGLMLGWLGLVNDPLSAPPDDLDQTIAIAFFVDESYGS